MARLTGQNSTMEVIAGIDADRHALAFEDLVALHEPRVRRLVHRLLGWRSDTADADDIVQDVFLAALEKLASFRGDADVATWLMAVAINRCRTHRRRQVLRWRWWKRQPRPSDVEAADHAITADETSAKVRSAVQSLPTRDREVIVLFYLEELPASEIAKLLGISRGAVDVRLHRARQRLKETLAGLME